MDNEIILIDTTSYPFPTPEISVDPQYQALYDQWAKERDAKQELTVEDKFNAIVQNPRAYTKIGVMGVFMALLALTMLIVFRRTAQNRRQLEEKMTACTRGRIVKTRMGTIGRRIVRYATVAYLREGYEREDEYLLSPEMSAKEGDEITVMYDPNDPALSQIGGYLKDNGREYDIVLIPFLVVGVGMSLFAILCALL